MAGRNLLQVGVGHGQAAGDRAAIIGAHLIDVRMDASCLGAEGHVGLQEGAVCLVGLAGLDDHLGQRMLVVVQELLGEAWQTVLRLAVLNAKAVECVGNGLGGPDVNLDACLLLHLLEQLELTHLHAVNHQATLVSVEADAPAGHLKQHGEHIGLQCKDGLNFLLAHLDLEVLPQL